MRNLFPRVRVRRPRADLITWFPVLLIVIHGWVEWQGGVAISRIEGGANDQLFYEWLGLSRAMFLEGRIWQVISFSLLHGSWSHAVLNAGMLYLLGGRIADMMHVKLATWAVILGVLGGGCLHLLFQSEKVLVGASPAIFCLLLLLTSFSPDSRMWPIPVSGKSLGLGLLIGTFLLALMTPSLGVPVFSRLGNSLATLGMEGLFQMSHWSHLGGAVIGWLLARLYLRKTPSLEDLKRKRERSQQKEC